MHDQPSPQLTPAVDDAAPTADEITRYDQEHFVTYARLLDAETAGADWREVVSLVLHRDPYREPELSRQCWDSHVARARWVTTTGYRQLLEGAVANQE
jgi:hypothetical protein